MLGASTTTITITITITLTMMMMICLREHVRVRVRLRFTSLHFTLDPLKSQEQQQAMLVWARDQEKLQSELR